MLNSNRKPSQKYLKLPFHPANAGLLTRPANTYHNNLKQPKVLPKGTVIECIAHYDNSANNPVNPNPKTEVFWGDQTWDEMLAGFLDLAVPVNMNTRDIAVPRKTAPPAAN